MSSGPSPAWTRSETAGMAVTFFSSNWRVSSEQNGSTCQAHERTGSTQRNWTHEKAAVETVAHKETAPKRKPRSRGHEVSGKHKGGALWGGAIKV